MKGFTIAEPRLREAVICRPNLGGRPTEGNAVRDTLVESMPPLALPLRDGRALAYEDVREAARRMLTSGVKRLPVVRGPFLAGIVSRRDLLRVFDRPDNKLEAEIGERLADPRQAPDDHNVTASVRDGVVTLNGSVRIEADFQVVERLIRDVAGVVDVRNALTVREPAPRVVF